MSWERELEICKEAAVLAGEAILKVYSAPEKIQVEYKEEQMPLTEADRRASRIITERLRQSFPDYGILSEEETDTAERLSKELCFIVDPLDGTKEFLKRNGQFTVNIALACRNRSVMGVIYAPVLGELYYAFGGNGAFLEKGGRKERIHVSDRREGLRACASLSHDCREMQEMLERFGITDIVRMGSSLKGCVVARGDAEIYYRHNPTMEWDTAAMQCIVEEAGGVFRQMDGSEMRYNRTDCKNRKGFYVLNCRENYLEPWTDINFGNK